MTPAARALELGDFQTPPELAAKVWRSLDTRGVDLVIEPTVGIGSFLAACPGSLRSTPWLCWDIQPRYVAQAREVAAARGLNAQVACGDVFRIDHDVLDRLAQDATVLVVGNPPWVTNAAQGKVVTPNLPPKWNRFGLKGLDAVTGKANFDIAEAALLSVLAALDCAREVRVALLVKRSVAMKVARDLLGAPGTLSASFARIDAKRWFGASVEAGLLQIALGPRSDATTHSLGLADELGNPVSLSAGICDGVFVEDIVGYERFRSVQATHGNGLMWRQGVKHDAATILELRATDRGFVNGLGESVAIEPNVLCPFYKSSDIANGRSASRYFPLYQHDLDGPFPELASRWPLLAAYLDRHSGRFAARGSTVYRGKPDFMLFGVGSYTLAPFKVAISGFYKQPRFTLLTPDSEGRPPVVDDTCYALPFDDRADAEAMSTYLNGERVQGFLKSIADMTAKRPYTKMVLSRIADPFKVGFEPVPSGGSGFAAAAQPGRLTA